MGENPKHLAIIMDGNGRWAKKRGLLRTFGHESGVESVRTTIEYCVAEKIPYLTLYAFSTENWNRPQMEVNMLMNLLMSSLQKEAENLNRNGVRLKAIGDLERLPGKAYRTLVETMDSLKENTQLTLTLALAYGGRQELVAAFQKMIGAVQSGSISASSITEQDVARCLYDPDLPDVDLLIRTSGEYRVSNFLLWQIAYAEMYFTDVLWPDFNREHLEQALLAYRKRERRFGKTTEQLK